MLGLWFMGCSAGIPRALPEAWAMLEWPEESAALHGTLWRELSSVPPEWSQPPVSASDVSVMEWWCGPSVDSDACWTGAVTRTETRDSAWRGLSAFADGGSRVTELTVDVGEVPAQGDWGMGVSLRLDAAEGEVIDWQLTLVRWAGKRLTARLDLGPTLGHGVEQTDFSVSGPDWSELIATPEAFGTQTLVGLKALLAEVERGITAHEVRRCAYGRYHGDGTPRCDRVPLTPSEEAGALEQARATLGHRIRIIEQDAGVLHAQLTDLLPSALAP